MRISAAVVHEAGGRFSIEDVDLDDPRAGEVVVRVAAAGLCHTGERGPVRQGRFPFDRLIRIRLRPDQRSGLRL